MQIYTADNRDMVVKELKIEYPKKYVKY